MAAFIECRDGLVRNLVKLCVRVEDVDDILQTTFMRVLEADRKQGVMSPKDYFFVVSRNMVVKNMSTRRERMRVEFEDALVEAPEPPADTSLYYRQKLRVFEQALRTQPEPVRQAIILRKFYGFSHREIADKMGVSVSSVEKYVANGILRCRDQMKSQGYNLATDRPKSPSVASKPTVEKPSEAEK
ncbi:MAG: sigma-70 family RNA polymerase sigma factor [Pseudomonadota bacterium]